MKRRVDAVRDRPTPSHEVNRSDVSDPTTRCTAAGALEMLAYESTKRGLFSSQP